MIHYWQCDRCTHQWCSSCMGEMLWKKEERERNLRQLSSGLCWDCFEQLEAGEIAGLELFDLAFYLEEKYRKHDEARSPKWMKLPDGKDVHTGYSSLCHPYKPTIYGPDGNTIVEKGSFEMPWTAEEEQLAGIASNVKGVYRDVIQQQRTAKRIELDDFQKTAGFVFFGEQPRPEGFVGDPPGKQRPEVLFGLDMKTGSIVAPTIKMNDGTGTCEVDENN